MEVLVFLEVQVLTKVIPVGIGGESGVSNIEGWLSGNDVTVVEECVVERDVGEKVLHLALELSLTEMELITSLKVDDGGLTLN